MPINKYKSRWRRVWLIFMLPLLFYVPAQPVYAGTQLIIHYQRPDGDYAPWNIWSWADGKDGAAYPFSGEDAFGVYAEITLPQDTAKAGFIVRTDAWEKDVSDDRFIDLSMGNEIWVYSATPEFLYEAPEGYAEEAVPIPNLTLTVHYNRYDFPGGSGSGGGTDSDFSGVSGIDAVVSVVNAASGGAPDMFLPTTKSTDPFGTVFTFELTDLTSRDKLVLGFTTEEESEEYTLSLRTVTDPRLVVYCVYGSKEQRYEEIDSVLPAIHSAVLDAPNEINLTMGYPLHAAALSGEAGNTGGAGDMGFILRDITANITVPLTATAANSGGNDIQYGKLTEGYATQFTLSLAEDLPLDHQYTVEGNGAKPTQITLGKVYASERFEALFTYTGDDLGAVYTPETPETPASTTFRLWAPVASEVVLHLLEPADPAAATSWSALLPNTEWPMTKDENGTWVCVVEGDLSGIEYVYGVTNYGVYAELVDPYAKAVGINGKTGAVVDLSQTNPAGWDEDTGPPLPNATDAVIYELHVRDFSTHPSSGMTNKGLYLAFTELGTTTADGQKTGVDHLKELGVTHVHLLPVFDYASIDESKPEANAFNWGYDPLNYNAPEGSYATDPYDPYNRINEFKQMVQSLHDNGIGVIMDVVYNHTGPSADSNLSLAVPNYYYRMNANGSFSNGSGCGNETASERAMVRKLMVDSVVYWAKEYHIDGFRFDLMGLHDVDTMNAVRAALDAVNPEILIYGEGWTGGNSPLPASQAALKANMVALDARIAAFSDDIRDGIKGSVFNAQDPGYVSGYYGRKEQIKFGVVGSVPHPEVDVTRLTNSNNFWAKAPTQTITYASAHDNLTLWDKLLAATPNASEEEHLAMNRLAAAIVFTSQGIPFIHAGEELARSKNGDENSYKSSDAVNQIKWDTKTERIDLFHYYQGLIALRKAYPAFRMTETAAVQSHITFLDTEAQIMAYTLTGSDSNSGNGGNGGDADAQGPEMLLIAVNADKSERTLTLPTEGKWDIVVDGTRAGTEVLATVSTVDGAFTMMPRSAYVMVYTGPDDGAGQSGESDSADSAMVTDHGEGMADASAASAATSSLESTAAKDGASRMPVWLMITLGLAGMALVGGAGAAAYWYARKRRR